jgi:uroporphyrinogen-III synthase
VNIVLTRERGKNDSLRGWLPPEAIIDEVPLTTTTYFALDDVRAALEASESNGHYRSVVVTSERSARYVQSALRASRPDVEIFVVGPTTARALDSLGIRAHVQGEATSETLAAHVSRGPVLLLGATSKRGELTSALRARDLHVDEVACYETVGLTLAPRDEASLRRADVLFIGAPSSWSVARDFVTDGAWVIVPGASTGEAVRRDHPRVIEGWGPELKTRIGELSH